MNNEHPSTDTLMFHSINLAEVTLWPYLLTFFFCFFFSESLVTAAAVAMHHCISPLSRQQKSYAEEWNTFCTCHFSFCPNFPHTFLSPLTVTLSRWTISNRFLTPCEASNSSHEPHHYTTLIFSHLLHVQPASLLKHETPRHRLCSICASAKCMKIPVLYFFCVKETLKLI